MIPIFASHFSIGSSILTLEKETDISPSKPVSLLAVAKKHNLKQIAVAEDNISSFWKAHTLLKGENIQLIYGVNLTACDDLSTEEAGLRTDGKICVWLRNDKAYFDFVRVYTEASTTGLHNGQRRITWARLNELWSDNFDISLPFYSSFLANNSLKLFHAANPSMGKLKPKVFLESHYLPMDEVIRAAAVKYAKSAGLETVETFSVKYYHDSDVLPMLTMKCLSRRSTWEKPECANFSSDAFSYATYLKRCQAK